MPSTRSRAGTQEVEDNSFPVLSHGERHFDVVLEVGAILFVIWAAPYPHG